MITISTELKHQALEALLAIRPKFAGSNAAFAKQWGINPSIFSQLRGGRVDGLVADSTWLNICRELNVGINERKWNPARTDVFLTIEEDILFCKQNSKARIFVDECEIGKTFAVKYLSRHLDNCFYVDASQAKTKTEFISKLAKTLGINNLGTYADVKENIKFGLKLIPFPIVIIDEAGDLEYKAFLELKELWNATEGACGWYLVGADGLRKKIEQGISNMKVGYRELFSRFSSKYSSIVPRNPQERMGFYKKLIGDVLAVNVSDAAQIPLIINKCITKTNDVNIGGLRRAESILLIN